MEALVFLNRLSSAIRSLPFVYPFTSEGRYEEALARARHYCSTLPQVVAEPVFVKVGANDGITGDPFSEIFLADTRWKGLLIEPVPYCFDRLKTTFRDSARFSLEQVAIGGTAGEATFYYVDQRASENVPDLPDWYDQLGSFDKNHILKHMDGVLAPFIIECKVEVLRLTDVLKRNGVGNVHLLHIDTEGNDFEVLKSLDLGDQRPTAIFIEHKHLPADQKMEMVSLLRKHGYCVHDCGGDYFAVNKDAEKRL